jgi:endonuclease/exonuclease/phosphatase family metal-dependent hydrolase
VNLAYIFAPSASDPEGDSLSFSINSLPVWAQFDAGTGTLTGMPSSNDLGTYDIQITVSDGTLTASLSFSITLVTPGTSIPFKAMTFNVRIGSNWAGREDDVYTVIEVEHAPDIVGLQEPRGGASDQQADIAAHFLASSYAFYRWDVNTGSNDPADVDVTNKNPILVNTNRFLILDFDSEIISVPVNIADASYDCGVVAGNPLNTATRHHNWVHLEDRSTGRRYVFYNTHYISPTFEPSALCQHALQTELLLDLIAVNKTAYNYNHKVVILCDCNVGSPETESLNFLLLENYIDDWQYINPVNATPSAAGVDHLFSGGLWINAAYYDSSAAGSNASDHRALIAELAYCDATSTMCPSASVPNVATLPADLDNPVDADMETVFLLGGCTLCHGALVGLGGLRLGVDDWKAQLVNVASTCDGTLLAESGNPAGSLLYLKITGMQDCGGSMPAGLVNSTLTADAAGLIYTWIRNLETDTSTEIANPMDADVASIFSTAGCYLCHGNNEQSAGLDLEAADWRDQLVGAAAGSAAAGGVCTGSVRVVASNADSSLLYQKVTRTLSCGDSMPFGATLRANDAATIANWINNL